MSAELSLQEDYGNFVIAPNQPIFYLVSRHLAEQIFIDTLLSESPHESIEDVSAVVHETNRIPDSRILIISEGKILRLDGVEVDKSIEKLSYLGKIEYQGFEAIKKWANTQVRGAEVWFSAPFPEDLPPEKQIYPVSKIDTGVIRYSSDRATKILLKKAILLDIDSKNLLGIANKFANILGLNRFKSAEELRSKPVFCTESELEILFEIMSEYTNQINQVNTNEDLTLKLNTYEKLKTIKNEIHIPDGVSHGNIYNYLRQRAGEEKMIGDKSESCPTAFGAFSGNSNNPSIEGNVTFIKCHCPKCDQEVTAMICGKTITCLSCGASATSVCV